MGSLTSKLVKEGEIPAFIQRDDDYCCGLVAQADEPGTFNLPKPAQLSELSDDHWASLKLRIDPLARKILDPHRSIFLAGILILLLWSVFRVVKPNLKALEAKYDGKFYDDDYYYSAFVRGVDDVDDNFYAANDAFQQWLESEGLQYEEQEQAQNSNSNSRDQEDARENEQDWYAEQYQDYVNSMQSEVKREYMYRLVEMEHDLVYWNLTFSLMVLALVAVTIHLSYGMLRRNSYYDAQMQQICQGEMRQRFQSEGFDIEYRTNHFMAMSSMGDCAWNMLWRPKRLIVFSRLSEDEAGYPMHTLQRRTPASPRKTNEYGSNLYDRHFLPYNNHNVSWTFPSGGDGTSVVSGVGPNGKANAQRQSTALYNPPSFVLNSPVNSPENFQGLDTTATFSTVPSPSRREFRIV